MINLSSEAKSTVNGSIPERAIERFHYLAKHSRDKRKAAAAEHNVNVSVQYDGDELDDEQVELVEQHLAYMLYDPVQRYC